MAQEKELSAQVAVVTGGARGIGKAICRKLAESGASVIINYAKSKVAAEELASELSSQDVNCEALQFDVSEVGSVDEAIKRIAKDRGRIDILVNNAGIAIDGLLIRTKEEDWLNTINVNLSACFYAAKAVAKPMMKARYGRIVNISSVIGESGNAGQVAYAASKSGIFGLTKSLAQELGSRSITANAITPGYISTDMTASMDDTQREALLKKIPLSRLGEAEDVADAVLFLCSPKSSYITGQILGVNGGLYM